MRNRDEKLRTDLHYAGMYRIFTEHKNSAFLQGLWTACVYCSTEKQQQQLDIEIGIIGRDLKWGKLAASVEFSYTQWN